MGYRFVVVLFIGLSALHPQAAEAAGGTTCTGYIESLPLAIDTPGVWCLRRNIVASTKPGGAALVVSADDVALDCRGFRIEASLPTRRYDVPGIVAVDRNNVVVRDCDIRGFWIGILLTGGRGHTVEHNVLEDSAFMGIYVPAQASEIRHNRVFNTGGYAGSLISLGIGSDGAHVRDNTVEGLRSPGGRRSSHAFGALIGIWPGSGSVSGNRVQQTAVEGTDRLQAIFVFNGQARLNIHDNDLIGPGGQGVGVECWSSTTFVTDNRINGFGIGVGPECLQGQNRVVP